MRDLHSVDAWMHWEFDKPNSGLVTRPRSLQSLLDDASPLQAKDGDPYDIECGVLERLSGCTPSEQPHLRLPVTLHVSADVEDSAYVIDPLAAEVLRGLGGWGAAYPYRDGKMWLPQSLAVDLILRYGGGLQRIFL